jgi:photosystem II stability/assembly factor-like uncharacterized protein
MHILHRVFLPCLLAGSVSIVVQATAAASDKPAAVTDPLDRPAQISPRSGNVLLTAITRAGRRLVTVGDRGVILLSDDSGATWRQARQVPVGILLTGLSFATPSQGWAVGHSGVVLKSIDAGETWVRQLDGRAHGPLLMQQLGPPGPGEIGPSKMRADAQRLISDGADKPLLDVLALDEHSAIVVGAFGLAFRTDDGGASWKPWQAASLLEKGSHLYAIRKSGKMIYVAGEQGTLFRSDDEGLTLTPLVTPYKGSFFGLTVLSPKRVLVFGLRGNAFLSDDAGASWQAVASGNPASFVAAAALPGGGTVMANQAGTLFVSHDDTHYAPLPRAAPWPVTGLATALDGSVVLVGLRGAARLPPSLLQQGETP